MGSLSRAAGSSLRVRLKSVVPFLTSGTLLLVLWLSPVVFAGGSPTPTAQAPGQDAPRVEVVDSSPHGITLEVYVPTPAEEQIGQQATTFQRLSLQGAGSASDIGEPELPSFGRFVAVPRGAQIHLEVIPGAVETRTGYLVYPTQQPRAEQGEEPPFALDAAAYQRDEYQPSEIVTVEGPYTVRGVEAVVLRFRPIQYNAAAKTLKLHPRFRVKVSFAAAGPMVSDQRLRSPYFESLWSGTLLNYADLGPAQSLFSGLAGATGCEFLIITARALVNEAHLLADWKTHRGMVTCVRTTAQTGDSASAIKSYIQNAYDSWNPPPSFVLFLGDAELIPTNYMTEHPQQQPAGSLIPTDLYYATVDGSDYFPDISTGRISVDTASQTHNIVTKLIEYERNPPYRASFYSTVAMAAYFQDDDDLTGYEDRDWIRTSEGIASYFGGMGYDEVRIYYARSLVSPLYYRNGNPLPFYLLRQNGFPWIGSTAEIVDWVNAGTLILNHRDHGMRWLWVTPELQVSHVQSLSNGKRLPMVFSLNCETGWFDNETDAAGHGTSETEVNFAEAWQRNQNGGAAGITAPTRISYGGYNDHLDKGLIDAIWPDFLLYTPSPDPFSSHEYKMGQVLNYARMYLATIYGESLYRQITFEMFHYFGDPTTEIWTAQPYSMAVQHSPVQYTGATSYSVRVEDGALVSLVRDGQILGRAVSSGGKATVSLSAPITTGTIDLTVTKHDRRPYESVIYVVDLTQRRYVPYVVGQ
jgi:hypothetical protein